MFTTPPKIYLLNEKAWAQVTGQNAKELFKNKALKRMELTYEELKKLNPVSTDNPDAPKVFFYDEVGMARVTFVGNSMATDWNRHLSHGAYIVGAKASNYLKTA